MTPHSLTGRAATAAAPIPARARPASRDIQACAPQQSASFVPQPRRAPPVGRRLPPALLRVALLATLLAAAAPQGLPAPPVAWGMPQARVLLGGQAFRVDVADTPELQQRGLAGRTTLGPLDGMVFPYARRGQPSFWMRGMLIPIDILWIDTDRIVYIAHRVPPPAPGTPLEQLPRYAPRDPANLVLEIAAGRAQALGVRVGDRVTLEF